MSEKTVKKQIIGGEEFEVLYRDSNLLTNFDNIPGGWGYYSPKNQRTYEKDGIVCEQDVPVTLRDGVTIYTDIYRPAGARNIPCIVAWSFFGKRPHDMPRKWSVYGVPDGTNSEMTKFEGPDPSYWCNNGYAVANPDPRGCGHSEGDMCVWGEQEAKDGYDFIEWLATQHWCNGNIGFSGNSALAMSQWFIAAEQPPHLKAIAPWEGCSDIYREFICEGGIPAVGFNTFVMRDLGGQGLVEDYPAMAEKYPLMNAYWESKVAKFDQITVPAYITGGYSHLHMRGAINGYRNISSEKKWLRLHRDFEWPDLYTPANIEDLKRFFDRYLKGIHNGWEMTPRVRMDIMDAYDIDFQVNRPETDFPIPRTEYTKLYLDAEKRELSFNPYETEAKTGYDAETGFATFDIKFDEDIEISGLINLRLWVEAQGHDNMDLFATMQKLDSKGNFIPTYVFGERHPGASGKLRVSHRELDLEKSTEFHPVHSHLEEKRLKPGEIVPIEIELYPYSRIWHKEQQLRIMVAGHYIRDPWFEPFSWDTDNKGTHIIHTGGKYDSYLLVPVIPPRYQAETYISR